MFFAVERELNYKRRRKSEELQGTISFSDDTGIEVGPGQTQRSPVKELDSVYPTFTSTRLDDVVRIVTDIELNETKPPTKKQRIQNDGHEAFVEGSPLSLANKAKNRHVTPQSFEELVKVFPQLETILAAQKQKLEAQRVSDEYIREMEKPKAALPQVSQTLPESKKVESGSWQPTFAVDSTKPQEPPPLPTGLSGTVPANAGGGLLSGIDDLFGSPKKKTRSKRR